jgi:hypothetical protein
MLTGTAQNLRYFAAMLAFLRRTLGPDEARRRLRQGLASREEAFLSLLQRGVYDQPRSPYRRLLLHFGYDFDAVCSLVRGVGLEPALTALYEAGVYLSPDEFKGRKRVRRPGLEFHASWRDLNGPSLGPHFEGVSNGSSGLATHVYVDFDFLLSESAPLWAWLQAHRLTDRPVAIWRPVPPDHSGFKVALRYARIGRSASRWFSPSRAQRSVAGRRTSLFMTFTVIASRLLRHPIPRPQYVPKERVSVVARWLAEQAARGRPAILETTAGPCVRVCLAAREEGLDISGTVFHIAGEPYTAAKAEVVESVGATAVNRYAMAELGVISQGCAAPQEVDDVHLLTNRVALITRDRPAADGDEPATSLVLTTLDPACPKLMLNVEVGDYATVSERPCDCDLGALGFTTHLSNIRAFDKLTSEGVTFAGSRLYELVERVLPSRFGGGPTDYQLVEEEERGIPRVSIVVAPAVGAVDETAVIDTVVASLEAMPSGALMVEQWRQGNTLRVVRREPYMTSKAKIMPLHVARPPAESALQPTAGPARE